MVWHGMVWYGIVWYGMAWHGMVWHGMACWGAVHCWSQGKADEYEGRYQTAMKTINQLKSGIHSIFSRIG